MSHCLKKMYEAKTPKSYDFWYYQSLLEQPYTSLLDYHGENILSEDIDFYTALNDEEMTDKSGRYSDARKSHSGVGKYGK